MGTVLCLPLPPRAGSPVSRLPIFINNSSCGTHGRTCKLVGARCPVPGDTVCILRPGLWLSGMTGSVIDMFINTATRRGGRMGHFCLLVAASSPDSGSWHTLMLQNGKHCLTLFLKEKKIVWGNSAVGARRLK